MALPGCIRRLLAAALALGLALPAFAHDGAPVPPGFGKGRELGCQSDAVAAIDALKMPGVTREDSDVGHHDEDEISADASPAGDIGEPIEHRMTNDPRRGKGLPGAILGEEVMSAIIESFGVIVVGLLGLLGVVYAARRRQESAPAISIRQETHHHFHEYHDPECRCPGRRGLPSTGEDDRGGS